MRLGLVYRSGSVGLESDDVTAKLKVAILATPPPLPVTVTVNVPVGVEDEVAMFNVREQVGLQEVDVV